MDGGYLQQRRKVSSICSLRELEPRRETATQKAGGKICVAINRIFNLHDKLIQFYGSIQLPPSFRFLAGREAQCVHAKSPDKGSRGEKESSLLCFYAVWGILKCKQD